MNTTRKSLIMFFALLIPLYNLYGCTLIFAMDEYVVDGDKKIYSLNNKDVESFLSSRGYSNYSIKAPRDLERNLKGDELWVFSRKGNTALIASCNGDILEVKLPGNKLWTNKSIWLDQENKVISWIDKEGLHYSAPPDSRLPVKNSCGEYFVKYNLPLGVGIFSIKNPDSPLATVNVLGSGILRIFSKGEKLYLFDYEKKGGPLMAYVFLRKGSTLEKSEEIKIPRTRVSPTPFYVEDLSPWSDDILLMDVNDWPFKSKWYVFNLQTRKVTKLGNAGSYGFFLSCEMLQP